MKSLVRETRLYLATLLLILTSGCASMKAMAPPEHATAIEQFLLTQAVDRSIDAKSPPLNFIEPEAPIKLETQVDDAKATPQQRYLVDAIGQWLGNAGFRLQTDAEKAEYKIKILVQALYRGNRVRSCNIAIESVLL